MSLKKTLSYVALGISIVLLFKILYDRNQPVAPSVPDGPPEVEKISIPTFPKSYALGTFDSRFGITEERFLQIVEQAVKVWEGAAGKDLFERRKDAFLKVNLVYDWRQEQLMEAKKRKAELDESGKSFDLLKSEHEGKARSVERDRLTYEESVQRYSTQLAEYNARAERWNEGKNQTEAEYTYLQARKKELEEQQQELDRRRVELGTKVSELNALGESINDLAQKLNLEVEYFNGKFVTMREFEKGIFDGRAIDIYEFENEDDLRLALVHEFGHALGLEHVDNPRAIMHRRLAAQDLKNIQLTSDDLTSLLARLR
ncbi:MAG: matrixin family metalloprotease [Ignavibacteria bacterium]|nr:matrixin family metalloprotease [Ignavibacteria bacterium]